MKGTFKTIGFMSENNASGRGGGATFRNSTVVRLAHKFCNKLVISS